MAEPAVATGVVQPQPRDRGSDGRHHPPVDQHVGAGDVVGSLGSEQQHDPGHFRRAGESCGRRAGDGDRVRRTRPACRTSPEPERSRAIARSALAAATPAEEADARARIAQGVRPSCASLPPTRQPQRRACSRCRDFGGQGQLFESRNHSFYWLAVAAADVRCMEGRAHAAPCIDRPRPQAAVTRSRSARIWTSTGPSGPRCRGWTGRPAAAPSRWCVPSSSAPHWRAAVHRRPRHGPSGRAGSR